MSSNPADGLDEQSKADQLVSLSDYRAQTADLYTAVRNSQSDPEETWKEWHSGHERLVSTHPLSPFAPQSLAPAPFWPYNPRWRFEVTVTPADVDDLIVEEEAGAKRRRFLGVGVVELDLGEDTQALPIYWDDSYAGGFLLPFRDRTNGTETFGSGRYALDGAKGSDLGRTADGKLIVDFNYAYHPSCVWGNWVCPLPAPAAVLEVEIDAGERRHDA